MSENHTIILFPNSVDETKISFNINEKGVLLINLGKDRYTLLFGKIIMTVAQAMKSLDMLENFKIPSEKSYKLSSDKKVMYSEDDNYEKYLMLDMCRLTPISIPPYIPKALDNLSKLAPRGYYSYYISPYKFELADPSKSHHNTAFIGFQLSQHPTKVAE